MRFLKTLLVEAGPRRLRINLAETDRIEAIDEGVRLYLTDRTYVHESSFALLLGVLDPSRFVQISPSVVVNLDRVAEFTVLPSGAITVTLQDGTTIEGNVVVSNPASPVSRGQ